MSMWTMFKKEWQENVLYLAAAFVLVLLVLDYTAHAYHDWSFLGISSSLRISTSLNAFIYQTDRTQTGPWTAMCIIAAVLLALRQIYTERLRRTWALLVQLPIQREKIICAKFLAGLTLLVTLFLPAGLLIAWRLSTPGVWPGPVYWMDFLPILLNLLAGLACYQIILLTALAPLRWFGTRLLIPFAAAPALVLAQLPVEQLVYDHRLQYMELWAMWVMAGTTLLVAVMGLWALRSVARSREY
jgi:ABC-type transport system involved in multi-copper enzyme maturation permease subunit